MKELVSAMKVLSDPSRVRILSALREGELCVCELCDSLAMTQSTLSTHLQVIRRAELISGRRQGKWMYYRITPQTRALLAYLFQSFASSMKKDAILLRDAKKLKNRLLLRNGDSCCVGFSGKGCQ